MRVTFFSNYLNHHQLPFCLAMERLTDGKFTFVASTPVPPARLELGYHDMNKQYPFVVTEYENEQNRQLAERLAMESDIVITGSAPEKYTAMRVRGGKLTFRYSERIYKEGIGKLFSLRHLRGMYLDHLRYAKRPLYMLCASAYTAHDYGLLGAYRGKTFKWGYFPEVKLQDEKALLECKRANKRVSILWVGRFLEFKHPEAAVVLAERLRSAGCEFEMNLIGSGELEASLAEMIGQKQLQQCVHLRGNMSPEEVRRFMEASDIFIFTSDFGEGWGAVLNEAMNSGCAVVASHAIGSVPFLLTNGENGLVYRNGDDDDLYECVVGLLRDAALREKLGVNAYRTLLHSWNADVAAQRLLQLADALEHQKTAGLFTDGPCSKAEILRNGWYGGR